MLIHQNMISWIQNISMIKSKPLSNSCNWSQLSGFLKNSINQRQAYRTEDELQVLKLPPSSLLIKWMDASCSKNNETVRIHCNGVQSSRQHGLKEFCLWSVTAGLNKETLTSYYSRGKGRDLIYHPHLNAYHSEISGHWTAVV